MTTANNLRIRDPFIVTDRHSRCYYLVCNRGFVENPGDPRNAVFVRRSEDLVYFEDPIPVLRLEHDAAGQCWAPEIHFYNGRWYLFTTLNGPIPGCGVATGILPDETVRGTAIFVADAVTGPFVPWSEGPVTPWTDMTLDGTLFVDKKGDPWMVYCHEWLQTRDGTVEAIPLTRDLKKAAGDPVVLFRGSAAPWSGGMEIDSYGDIPIHDHCTVTDGPFLFYDLAGALCMLWSTVDDHTYKTGVARSASGELTGPWEQSPKAIFADDGGHGMLFRTLEDDLMLTLHQPNSGRAESLQLLPVRLTGEGVVRK